MRQIKLLLLALFIPLLIHSQESVSDSIMVKFLSDKGIAITTNNKAKLLMSGHDKFEDLFKEIKKAKHHVHLEYFNFRNDSIANALFKLLAIKAAEGVEVRALFDAFGNWSNNKPLKKKHLKKIRKQGIEIVKFDPFYFPYINHAVKRDHRKIVVIDGKVGYTGGMNIADYYIHGLPKIGEWRDIHMKIEGGAVKQLQKIFLDTWNQETKQKIGGPQYFPPANIVTDSLQKEIAIVDRQPKITPKAIRRSFVAAIDAAKENIQIVNPYFIPTQTIKRAIRRASKRGVHVEIMIPEKADIPFTPAASFYAANKLRKHGASIYLFQAGFHHSKIMMIDNSFCTVGTANMNSRSLRYDYETNAFIFDDELTHQLNEMFEADKLNSKQLTEKVAKDRSAWKKFMSWFANLFTPVL